MGRKKLDPEDRASIQVMVKLTPRQAAIADALIEHSGEPRQRPDYLRSLIAAEYVRQQKYGGMKAVQREQGGTDG